MDKNAFSGPGNGYIVTCWDELSGRWTFRPVLGGPLLSDAEVAALGLDAPLLEGPPVLSPVQRFSQTDPRWANEKLGASNQTIGGWGCAMVVACMVYSQHDPQITPREFNGILTRHNGFNYPSGQAHLAWDRLPGIFPALAWKGRQDWNRRLTEAELTLVKDKLKVMPLPLWVDFKPATPAMDTHFVLGMAYADGDIQIYDPWGGDEAWLLKRYALTGQDLQRALWGYRELVIVQGVG